MMFIRNRRQVPLCNACHNEVHMGDYTGPSLESMFTKKLADNRIMNPENYVIKGTPYEGIDLEESLLKRGWTKE